MFASLAALGCGDDLGQPEIGGEIVPAVEPAPPPAPVADDATSLVPFDAYQMNPGECKTLATFTVRDDTIVRFVVLGSNLQPLSVGIGYVGPKTSPDLHHSYAWVGAGAYSPYSDQTPAPLVGGEYQLMIACGNEAALPCIFGFKAWFTAGGAL